jgi:hypothetical protein
LSPTLTAAEPATTDGAEGAFGSTVPAALTGTVVVIPEPSGTTDVVVVDTDDFGAAVITGVDDTGICD